MTDGDGGGDAEMGGERAGTASWGEDGNWRDGLRGTTPAETYTHLVNWWSIAAGIGTVVGLSVYAIVVDWGPFSFVPVAAAGGVLVGILGEENEDPAGEGALSAAIGVVLSPLVVTGLYRVGTVAQPHRPAYGLVLAAPVLAIVGWLGAAASSLVRRAILEDEPEEVEFLDD